MEGTMYTFESGIATALSTTIEGLSAVIRSTVPLDKATFYTIEALPFRIPSKPTSSISAGRTSRTATANATSTITQISKGQIAGIAIGAVVFIGIIAGLFMMQIQRRRRHVLKSTNDHGFDPYHVKAELHNDSVPLAELEGHGMFPEMDGYTQPVEAPQPETSGGQEQVIMEATTRNQCA
ncbi:hypothetical protein PG993_014982 [Apiospora rasikravindrae]|uniref:Mid2 domain-containing protein n=1 Tax=Apiospora rasikravindrae TaxID=990691 RepID=A0ABR1RPE4_9PEZI